MFIADPLSKIHPSLVPPIKMCGDKISPVQPTIFKHHIDFDSVVAISNAYHIDRRGSGGDFIAFDIKFRSDLPGVEGSTLHYEWSATWPITGSIESELKFLQEFIDIYIDLWEKIKIQERPYKEALDDR